MQTMNEVDTNEYWRLSGIVTTSGRQAANIDLVARGATPGFACKCERCSAVFATESAPVLIEGRVLCIRCLDIAGDAALAKMRELTGKYLRKKGR